MKVNTDAVLIGAWSALPTISDEKAIKVLDVGSGTGVIALIVAQRVSEVYSTFKIEGIDIEPNSFAESRLNFKNSPWSNSLYAKQLSLQSLYAAGNNNESYNLIISNPPYFSHSLKGSNQAKTAARHNDTLPLESLISISAQLLKSGGVLSIILPTAEAKRAMEFVTSSSTFKEGVEQLSLTRVCWVKSRDDKEYFRALLEFKKGSYSKHESSSLIMGLSTGGYTKEYIDLVEPFYLHPLKEGESI